MKTNYEKIMTLGDLQDLVRLGLDKIREDKEIGITDWIGTIPDHETIQALYDKLTNLYANDKKFMDENKMPYRYIVLIDTNQQE